MLQDVSKPRSLRLPPHLYLACTITRLSSKFTIISAPCIQFLSVLRESLCTIIGRPEYLVPALPDRDAEKKLFPKAEMAQQAPGDLDKRIQEITKVRKAG